MRITYHGHSCFSVESNGYTVVLDPFTGVDGFEDIDLAANQVICSHGHFDHAYTAGVRIAKAESPFTTASIPCFHDECGGAKRGNNLITVLKAEGKRIVHLGDLGHLLSDELIEEIRSCDVLMIPVGGFYTFPPEEAARLALAIQPKLVIPMHYRDESHGFSPLETVDAFISLLDPALSGRLALVKAYEQSITI